MDSKEVSGTTYKVGISGSFGGLNLGDEAILQCMTEQLRNSVPAEITVFSRNAEDTQRRHCVERVINVRDRTRTEVQPEIERLDLFILGGGGILFNADARTYLREMEIACQAGVPCMLYAAGVGPLADTNTQSYTRDVLKKASAVTVRERGAKKALEDIGLDRHITVTADPAFLLKPEAFPEGTLERELMHDSRRLVGMSVREPGAAAPDIDEDFYHDLLANAADFIIDRYNADVVFIPMERSMLDMQHSHAVISQMLHAQRAWVLKGLYTSAQILSLMGSLDFAVGMRLHFLIFAALQGVPFVALPYSGKVIGLLDDFGIEMPPIKLVDAGRLIAYIDRSWDRRTTIKSKIRQVLPGVQERALETNRVAVNLLKRPKGLPTPVIKQ